MWAWIIAGVGVVICVVYCVGTTVKAERDKRERQEGADPEDSDKPDDTE